MTRISTFAGRIVREGDVAFARNCSLQIRSLRVADVEHLTVSGLGRQVNAIQSSVHVEKTVNNSRIVKRVIEISRARCAEVIVSQIKRLPVCSQNTEIDIGHHSP